MINYIHLVNTQNSQNNCTSFINLLNYTPILLIFIIEQSSNII